MATVRVSSELDSKGFRAGANDIEQRVEGLRRKLTKPLGMGGMGGDLRNLKSTIAGAFSIGAIGAFARSVVESVARVKDLSEQTGLSTDQVQALDFAAKQVGLSFDSVVPVIGKIQTKIGDMMAGDPKATKDMAALGITMQRVAAIPVNDRVARVMEMIGAKAKDASRGTGDFAALTEVLGDRAGPRLTAVLEQLGNGFDFAAGRAKAAGALIDPATIKVIDAFDKQLQNMGSGIKQFAAMTLGPLITWGDTIGRTFGRAMAGITADWQRGKAALTAGDFKNAGSANWYFAWLKGVMKLPATWRGIVKEKADIDAKAAAGDKARAAAAEKAAAAELAATQARAAKEAAAKQRKVTDAIRKATGDVTLTVRVQVLDDEVKRTEEELKALREQYAEAVKARAAAAPDAGPAAKVELDSNVQEVAGHLQDAEQRLMRLRSTRIQMFSDEQVEKLKDLKQATDDLAAKRKELGLPVDARLNVQASDVDAREELKALEREVASGAVTPEAGTELLDAYKERHAIVKDVADLEKQITATRRDQAGTDRERAEASRKAEAGIKEKLAEFKPSLDLPQVDQIARIGGQIGGSMSAAIPTAQRQVQLADEALKVMREEAGKLDNIAAVLKTLPPAIAAQVSKNMGLA